MTPASLKTFLLDVITLTLGFKTLPLDVVGPYSWW